MDIPTYPRVAGSLPDNLRPAFSQPLPSNLAEPLSSQPGVQEFSRTYHRAREIGKDPALPDEYNAIIAAVASLGRITLLDGTGYVTASFRQGPANLIGKTGWHTDDFIWPYTRAVVNDMLGTKYKTADGRTHTTPDFGILVLNSSAQHTGQVGPANKTKTRLQLTRHPLASERRRWMAYDRLMA